MRNVLLVGVSFFALGIGSAMAAPEVKVDDASEGSVNEIMQDAPDTEAKIMIMQTGDGGDAPGTANAPEGTNVYINQASDEDSMIDVIQDGVGGGNSIYVDQEAMGGVSSVMASQMGEANQADVMQMAADSTVTLNQDGTENMATVDQMADENIATIDQWGEENTASIVQDGMMNDADIDQGESGTTVEMNTAMVFQHGMEGTVVVKQTGSENYASAKQHANVDGATIDIMQSGIGGSTTVVQGMATTPSP